MMKLDELDFENIAIWPMPFKMGAIAIMCIFIMIAGYYLDIRNQQQLLETAISKEKKLKKSFERKQQQSANLEAYQEQMKDIEKIFGNLLRQLPESTEVPGLVEDISHVGLANGLQFKTIKLRPEHKKDFYTELPIEISVEGTYHELGQFISDVSALPRIVTLHDFTLSNATRSGKSDKLKLDILARTYRYTADEVH